MSSGRRWPRGEAHLWARDLVARVHRSCHRVAIAGSLRRGALDVGDVELVCVAKVEPRPVGVQCGLWGDDLAPTPLVWGELEQLLGRPAKGGDRFRQWAATDAHPPLDVFAVHPQGYGYQLALRTGPADWSRLAVIRLAQRGYKADGGLIYQGGKLVPCEQESDFFRLLAVQWCEPAARSGHTFGGQ